MLINDSQLTEWYHPTEWSRPNLTVRILWWIDWVLAVGLFRWLWTCRLSFPTIAPFSVLTHSVLAALCALSEKSHSHEIIEIQNFMVPEELTALHEFGDYYSLDPEIVSSSQESNDFEWQLLPSGLMYRSYLAGEKEPRIGWSALYDLKNQRTVWETALLNPEVPLAVALRRIATKFATAAFFALSLLTPLFFQSSVICAQSPLSPWRFTDEADGKSMMDSYLQPLDDHPEDISIPEPLLFDLVRPLGAKKGELEVNTLAQFPWRALNIDTSTDPFGSGQITRDRGGIEWAPEIEYAFADGWAVEFELPFEGSKLESYKTALQGTFGTAFNNQYIHGFQSIIEPTTDWKRWSGTLLYLGGIRFDEKWSALFMAGGRMNLAGANNTQTFERLLNATLFREVTPTKIWGLEVNMATGNEGRRQTILIPQLHCELNERTQIQSGIGLGVFDAGYEQSFIMRLVRTR